MHDTLPPFFMGRCVDRFSALQGQDKVLLLTETLKAVWES